MSPPTPRRAPLSTLRSFTRAGRTAPPTTPAAAFLRSIMDRPRDRAGERCEMCGERLGTEHGHVASLDEHRLVCACRACWLLFTRQGAAGGRYAAVPERYRYEPAFALSPAQWDSLQIPVDLVFFFRQSDLDRVVACYPAPSGATESQLDLTAWRDVAAANPALATMEPDVEAALVRRARGAYQCYLVPIDACYELVGLVRTYWTGFHGGDEVWARIDGFFDRVRSRCEPVAGEA